MLLIVPLSQIIFMIFPWGNLNKNSKVKLIMIELQLLLNKGEITLSILRRLQVISKCMSIKASKKSVA